MKANTTSQSTKRPYRTEAQWHQLIAAFEASDLSVNEYCAEHNLKYTAFYQWRKRLQSKPSNHPSPPSLIELTDFAKTPSSQSSSWDIELELGSGTFLRIRRA